MDYNRASATEDGFVAVKENRSRPKPHLIVIAVLCVLVLIAIVTVVIFVVVSDSQDKKKTLESSDYYDASISPLQFYSEDDAALLNWYQSADNLYSLEDAIVKQTNFITTDVSHKWQGLNKLLKEETQEIMVGHPVDMVRNMTFELWLDLVLNVTDQVPVVQFHTIQEAEDGLEVLFEHRCDVQQPVFIHANILQGPNSNEKPVDQEKFLTAVNFNFPLATLSLGWTNEPGPEIYTWDHIVQMWSIIQNATQPVTLHARASLFPGAWEHFKWLLHQDQKKLSITVWHPEEGHPSYKAEETVDVHELVRVRNDIQKKFLYYNFPEPLYSDFIHYGMLAGNPLNHFNIKSWDALEVHWTRIQQNSSSSTLSNQIQDKKKHMMLSANVKPDGADIVLDITWRQETTGAPLDEATNITITQRSNVTEVPMLPLKPTLELFLEHITQTSKGIKLSILETDDVEATIETMNDHKDGLLQPVWLHADVLEGPNSLMHPVEPEVFLSAINTTFPHATISLGWTSSWNAQPDQMQFTESMIKNMSAIAASVQQPVNIVVPVYFIVAAWDWIQAELLDSTSYWLTVWARDKDYVDMSHLLFVRNQEGVTHRVFYDLPHTIMSEFKQKLKEQNNGYYK